MKRAPSYPEGVSLSKQTGAEVEGGREDITIPDLQLGITEYTRFFKLSVRQAAFED